MAIINITKQNFDSEVLKSDKTVLLDFWASWCGPCRMVAPIVEQIAEENPEIVLGKVDVDEERELAIRFNIVSIPTLVVIRNGEVVQTAVGYRPKEDILKLLDM